MNNLSLVSRAMEREAGRVYLQAGKGFHVLRSLASASTFLGLMASLGPIYELWMHVTGERDGECLPEPFFVLCVSIPLALLAILGITYLRGSRERLALEMTLVRLDVLRALSRS